MESDLFPVSPPVVDGRLFPSPSLRFSAPLRVALPRHRIGVLLRWVNYIGIPNRMQALFCGLPKLISLN